MERAHLGAAPEEALMGAYIRPSTLSEAVQALAESGGVLLSGGTDFFPALGNRAAPETVIDISAIGELKGIHVGPEHIEIGGRTTWSEILARELPRGFDGLKAAAREIGGVQIQNVGTIAGNLCNASPAADSVPPLLTLDAEVTLLSAAGPRTIPLSEFIVGNRKTVRQPGEILTRVSIPRHLENCVSTFLKLGARRYLVISIAMVAVNLLLDDQRRIRVARLAIGSCSAKALRLASLEQLLTGETLRPGISRIVSTQHLEGLSPMDDVRATAAYRTDAAKTLVGRALEDCSRRDA
jgi:CO/xanthine dehydrogenase FAD-binding subunit